MFGIIRHEISRWPKFLKGHKIPETFRNAPKLHKNRRIFGIPLKKFPEIRNFLKKSHACIMGYEMAFAAQMAAVSAKHPTPETNSFVYLTLSKSLSVV